MKHKKQLIAALFATSMILTLMGCGTTMSQKMQADGRNQSTDAEKEVQNHAEQETETQSDPEEVMGYQFEMLFAGTIDLSEDAANMDTYRFYESNLSQCISETFRKRMKAADFCIANCLGEGENEITRELGIDFDSNFNFGEAGDEEQKSVKVLYFTQPDLESDETELSEQTAQIAETVSDYDFAVVYILWNQKEGYEISEAQSQIAHAYIDAGADAVIGTDSYVVQGLEFYEGKPIAYSLGNFWSDTKSGDTILVSLVFRGVGEAEKSTTLQILPGARAGGRSAYLNKPDEQLEFIENIKARSVHVEIDENGYAYDLKTAQTS